MAKQRLTDRVLATGLTGDDLIHVVITGDTSQSPVGSSYKATISQLLPILSGASNSYTVDAYLSGNTIVFDNNNFGSNFYNVDLSSIIGGSTTFSGLTDTNISGVSTGDHVVYSGSVVINVEEKFDYFTASTENQTVFTSALTTTPLNVDRTQFFINGVKQRYGVSNDYIITGGTNLVWVTNKHNINTDDELSIIYL